MKSRLNDINSNTVYFCKGIPFLLLIVLVLSAFSKLHLSERLIFETEKSMRSSFCLYSDGKFYDAQAAGCTGQLFGWGYWKKIHDTVQLSYQSKNIFKYDIIESRDSVSEYQVIRIIDDYDQPVRFQLVYYDTTAVNLYNPAILTIKKGSDIYYPVGIFNDSSAYHGGLITNADTITYKWRCNRECLESIDGGDLAVNKEEYIEKAILGTKRIRRIP
jgi:hypothetical protein